MTAGAEQGESPLRPEHFWRHDNAPDAEFYVEPRLVTHIDDAAIAAAGAFYGRVLPAGGRILDLMTSWVSHLPDASVYAGVTGLGMNAEELAANPQLDEWVVHDLNANPVLPWPDNAFAAAIVTVSVQYLTRPAEVFAEVGRVLQPGGPFVVTYSNRCFPTKAVAAWQMLDDRGHADLIGMYFALSGAFGPVRAYDLSPNPGRSDPLFAVVAHAEKGPGEKDKTAEG
ncbi:MAG: methyltransferase domain-containing protein [Dehalococcoidia bacterium]|nr:methyltransferase domain-containing protein [Dehalococcoidia bacterium]